MPVPVFMLVCSRARVRVRAQPPPVNFCQLLPNANTRRRTTAGRYTPLHWAAYLDNGDVAQMLIDANADVNITDAATGTPLMWWVSSVILQLEPVRPLGIAG